MTKAFTRHFELLQDQIDLFNKKIIQEKRKGSPLDYQISNQIDGTLKELITDFGVLKGLHDEGKFPQQNLIDCYLKLKRCARELYEMWTT